MKKIAIILYSVATLLFSASCGPTTNSNKSHVTKLFESWDVINDPLRLGNGYERRINYLPLTGKLETIPWADSYWPSYKGGIAARWPEDSKNFAYKPPTFAALKRMSIKQISELSPAEKFDIISGNYDYPTLQSERKRTSPSSETWEGICHGWAPASLHFTEPKPVNIKSSDGLTIPFGSSDIKALLSYYQGQVAQVNSYALGARCNIDLTRNPRSSNRPECRDVNAGSFHLIITNFIALRHQGFVADVTRDLQVWNHPVYGYSYRILKTTSGATAGAAPGTVAEATIALDMQYIVESVPMWQPNSDTNYFSKIKHYKYVIELNRSREIIGGRWLTSDRPDFLWTEGKPEFVGDFAILGQIYSLSTGEPINPRPTPAPTVVPVPTEEPTVVPVPTPVPTVVPVPTEEPTVVPILTPTVNPRPSTNRWLKIINSGSNLCLTVLDNSMSNGADIVQEPCSENAMQYFTFLNNGLIKIRNSNQCLQMNARLFVTKMEQRNCNPNEREQHFILQKISTNEYAITLQSDPNKCVAINRSSTSSGAKIGKSKCNGSMAQAFRLE